LRRVDLAAIASFLVLWGSSVVYLAISGADWVFPLVSLGVFGGVLSAVAWWTTRGAEAKPIEVARPARESAAFLIYLGVYAIVFLGWGLSAARAGYPPGPAQEWLILGLKLAVHVVLPALILLALGARLAPLMQARLGHREVWLTLVVLGALILGLLCVVSPSLRDIAALNPTLATLAWALPLGFIWIAVEAGLSEEFLYRAVLQTRLTALFGSAWAGVLATSVLFGLAHMPGLYLRGGPGVDGWSTDPFQVAAFTLATLAPLSVLFGFIYHRTRSLLLVVLLHACVDVLPHASEFIGTWAGPAQ
jgi:membrane protease YdiL (CAAX protease family)